MPRRSLAKIFLIVATTGLLGIHSALGAPFTLDSQVMGAQRYRSLAIDRSVEGGPLLLGDKVVQHGFGAHAPGEFPLAVPADAVRFRGQVALDGALEPGQGSVRFRILGGESVLWESREHRGGQEPESFSIDLIPGSHRVLYLQSDDLGQMDYDHANWLHPVFDRGGKGSAQAPRVLAGRDFGLVPDSKSDQSSAMRRAIGALRAAPGSTLQLEKGTYHFHAEQALRKHFHISNHDQPVWHPVGIPLVDLRDATIDGQGSLFLFDGVMQPMLIMDSDSVNLRGIAIDYGIPHHASGRITARGRGYYEISIDPKKHPHSVKDGWFEFSGPGWTARDNGWAIVFDGKTGEIVAGTSDFRCQGAVEMISMGRYRVALDLSKSGIKVGDQITFRLGWQRPHPAITVYRARKTGFQDVVIHSSHGMGLLAQRSEDITFSGGGAFPRDGSGRPFSTGADATHFSNCRGKILVENARFEAMMDDAINVHATCLRVEEVRDPRTLILRYMHPQALGFETLLPGEMARIIKAKTLEPADPVVIERVRRIDNHSIEVRAQKAWPGKAETGDAVETETWHPEIVFRSNLVKHNRARGALFTTPRRVLVENNHFDTIAGSAILLAGDANGWYESGACEDLVIRGNRFSNNLTSRFQFTEAVISIYPEVPDLQAQRSHYHRNILIEGNQFDTFDVPLLFAISTKKMDFKENRVIYNEDYPSWQQAPFQLRRCSDVTVAGNKVIGADGAPIQWSNKSVSADSLSQAIDVN